MPVEGEELFRVLTRFYGALGLPFRPESVGSAHRAGNVAPVGSFIEASAAEAGARYGAERVPLDNETLALARQNGSAHLV